MSSQLTSLNLELNDLQNKKAELDKIKCQLETNADELTDKIS